MLHVTNLTPPGSECNPAARYELELKMAYTGEIRQGGEVVATCAGNVHFPYIADENAVGRRYKLNPVDPAGAFSFEHFHFIAPTTLLSYI